MSERITRRETLKRGLVATSLLALWSDWNFPALAQGETDVPFTDIPANFNTNPSATTRLARHPENRWSLHSAGSVFRRSALQPAANRCRLLPAEVDGDGEEARGILCC